MKLKNLNFVVSILLFDFFLYFYLKKKGNDLEKYSSWNYQKSQWVWVAYVNWYSSRYQTKKLEKKRSQISALLTEVHILKQRFSVG